MNITLSICTLIALFITSASIARASSPGMIEGPEGASWQAVVVSSRNPVKLKLTKYIGSCTYQGYRDVDASDIVTIESNGKIFKKGQIVEVWIDGNPSLGTAHWEKPECRKTPAEISN